jgi:antitoxin PrlF
VRGGHGPYLSQGNKGIGWARLRQGEDIRRMSFVTLRARNQIRLPAEIVRAAGLAQGDPIEVRYLEGVITLVPSHAWFWAPEWQEGEREASADIARGKVSRFESDQSFLKSLE